MSCLFSATPVAGARSHRSLWVGHRGPKAQLLWWKFQSDLMACTPSRLWLMQQQLKVEQFAVRIRTERGLWFLFQESKLSHCPITESGTWICKVEIPGTGVAKESTLSILGKHSLMLNNFNVKYFKRSYFKCLSIKSPADRGATVTCSELNRVTRGAVLMTPLFGLSHPFKSSDLNSHQGEKEAPLKFTLTF